MASLVFSGTVHGGLPVDKLLEKCRFGVYVDAVILRTFGDELPGKWFLGFVLVP